MVCPAVYKSRPWKARGLYQHIMDEKGCETMIINSSSVSMSSERNYAGYATSKSESLMVRADSELAASISISEESQTMLEQLRATKKSMSEESQARQQANIQNQLDMLRKQATENAAKSKNTGNAIKDATSMELELLKRILEMLNSGKGRHSKGVNTKGLENRIKDLESQQSRNVSFSFGFSKATVVGVSESVGVAVNGNVASNGTGTDGISNTWVKHTVTSSFLAEVENTAFSTTGIAKTADGREISFNLELEMSRSFILKNETYVQTMEKLVDPLVINVGSDVASVSDQKFFFDLDADGREEEISYLAEGSGFLALDKNGDGTVNNGNELFGTKSGDGFKDLAVYDDDGNGWIDEADSVFDKLRIWTKNPDGTDKLVAIGKAGIGAIYLGNTETEFNLKNYESGATNAVIQKSGVFLYEDGGVGTVQHVDMVV